jgi:hypothetical protein
MVRRGSTVRVRQRALEKASNGLLCCQRAEPPESGPRDLDQARGGIAGKKELTTSCAFSASPEEINATKRTRDHRGVPGRGARLLSCPRPRRTSWQVPPVFSRCPAPRRSSGRIASEATSHPALIRQEAARSSRKVPAIPATAGPQDAANGGNPRLSPLRPEAP